MSKRYIKITKKTQGHDEVLNAFGLETEKTTLEVGSKDNPKQEECYCILNAGEVLDVADVSTPQKAREVVKQIKNGQAVLGYHTKVKLPGGKETTLNGPFVTKVASIPCALSDEEGAETGDLDLTPFVTKADPAETARRKTAASDAKKAATKERRQATANLASTF